MSCDHLSLRNFQSKHLEDGRTPQAAKVFYVYALNKLMGENNA